MSRGTRRFPHGAYSGPVDRGASLPGPHRAENEPPTQGDNQLVSTSVLNAADVPQNWLMHNGTLDSQRFSRLDQINRTNVANLELMWTRPTRQLDGTETTPLVVDGVMFVTEAPSGVVARDGLHGHPHRAV